MFGSKLQVVLGILPVLLYSVVAELPVNLPKCKLRIGNACKTMMYKIFGVSGDTLKFISAYTNCMYSHV